MNERVSLVFRYLRHMVLPERCPFCGQVMEFGRHCCKDCESQAEYFPLDICALCLQRDCRCSLQREGMGRAAAAFAYEGLPKEAVQAMKFRDRKSYGEHLAWHLAQRIQANPLLPQAQGIAFMPMSRRKKRKRGYNQAEVLARHLSRYLGLPLYPVLVTLRETKTQHELSAAARKHNLDGAYGAVNQQLIQGKTLILVDDVITTGSSMGEAGKVLLQAGAAEVIPAAVCRVRPGSRDDGMDFSLNPGLFQEE